MSLDISPDGDKIVFDLLGDNYMMPISGGKANRITEGMAFDTNPRFSPDGKSLAYTSDASGGNNIWIRDLETNDSTQITKEKYLQTAVELMPYDPVINDHYADTLWMLKKNIQARYFWKHVLNLDDTEQKLKNNISKKLIFGITTKL